MHPEMARMMVEQHQHELSRQTGRQRLAAMGPRQPRLRVHWSRMTLSAAEVPGRRERSWVIVISATRGL
jgi:hypothetical protein